MKIDPKEQIAYNLAFYGEDAETRSSIIRVLYQLPEDVVIFALDRCVIAHEIAHAWLGHDRISAYDTETWEIDAANLTKSWGFKGRGSDADFCDF